MCAGDTGGNQAGGNCLITSALVTRIAIDTFAARPPWNYGGIYEYTRQLLHQFRSLAPEYDCTITALLGRGYHSLLDGLQDSRAFRATTSKWIEHPRIWRYGGCGLEARQLQADVVFLPCPDVLPVLMPPFVVTIHDVPFLETNSYSRIKNWRFHLLLQQITRRARKILVNSEYTKRDVVRHLGVEPEKIAVTYLSYCLDKYNTEPADANLKQRVRDKWKLQRPYILHCGTLQQRKNLVRLIEAYELMISKHPEMNFDLVLAGKWWRQELIVKAADRVIVPGRVVLTGLTEEDELEALVKGAALSVIPSLCEGFCLPMIESMACGVPTVVANNSCLPEVSGGVLRYFDAESVEEIAHTMHSVLESPSEQQRLRKDGLQRAAEFSWERCARQTLEVLREAARGS
jgi:glycosyltransferase involved in cell wall biosynthesis